MGAIPRRVKRVGVGRDGCRQANGSVSSDRRCLGQVMLQNMACSLIKEVVFGLYDCSG